jgi:hypothetical protein
MLSGHFTFRNAIGERIKKAITRDGDGYHNQMTRLEAHKTDIIVLPVNLKDGVKFQGRMTHRDLYFRYLR